MPRQPGARRRFTGCAPLRLDVRAGGRCVRASPIVSPGQATDFCCAEPRSQVASVRCARACIRYAGAAGECATLVSRSPPAADDSSLAASVLRTALGGLAVACEWSRAAGDSSRAAGECSRPAGECSRPAADGSRMLAGTSTAAGVSRALKCGACAVDMSGYWCGGDRSLCGRDRSTVGWRGCWRPVDRCGRDRPSWRANLGGVSDASRRLA